MLEVKHYMAPFYYVYLYVYIIVIIHLCTTRKSLSPLNGTLLCLSTTLCGCVLGFVGGMGETILRLCKESLGMYIN